jgi:DNA-binding transcriptional ArsR family regulator
MAARATAQRVSSRVPATGSAAPIKKARPQAAATSLDRLLHDPMRLGIASALAAGGEMTFTDLKSALGATDGNLSVHARKLEDAGYVGCEKSFDGRTPRTAFTLTASGRRALEKYLDHMDAIIRAARTSRGRS